METVKSRPSRQAFLGEILVAQGVLTPEQLQIAVNDQKRRGERLGTILIQSGFCTEEDIAGSLAAQLKLPRRVVAPEEVDHAALRVVSESFLRTHAAVPLLSPPNRQILAVADPFDLLVVDTLERQLGKPIETVIATSSDIQRALDGFSAGRSDVDQMLAGVSNTARAEGRVRDEVSVEELVRSIIQDGVKRSATDIHIEPESQLLRIRYRVDGILVNGPVVDKDISGAVLARVKVIANLDIAEQRLPQDGRARVVLENTPYDLRVSTLPTIHGENIVLRVLDTRTALRSPQDLGFSRKNLDTVRGLLERSFGLFLVTGPTGSGKSTTLYSLLSTMDAISEKVMTVEDPVEYRVPFVRQVQVNTEIGLSFAAALRSILRQDPDVILVGEIRDLETAEIAVRAALTGHFVFSTLHTNTAAGAIPRLVDMGVDAFLLKSALAGVLSQRLVRRNCTHCREEYAPTAEERSHFPELLREKIVSLYRGRGCDKCRQSGFSGRFGIHEVLPWTETFREMNLQQADTSAIEEIQRDSGYHSIVEDGLERVLLGETTLAEVLRTSSG